MKPYIIAGVLFVTGLLVLGVVTANLMSPPDKPKPHASAAAPPQRKAGGGFASSNPGDATYPAATPATPSGATRSMTSGMQPPGMSTMPGMSPAMPGTSGSRAAGLMPPSNTPLGVSGSIGISAPPAISSPQSPLSKSQNNTQPSVPIIQPTDIGEDSSPTAGKSHQ